MKIHYPELNMDKLCRLFGYSRQAYYQLQRYEYKCQAKSQIVLEMVQKERKTLPGIGTRKLLSIIGIHMKKEQLYIGRDAFFDLLRTNQMLVRPYRSRRKTTDSRHRFHKYPNLIRELTPVRAHELWVSDITYVETNEGYLYLSLITDAYSRKIVGWNISPKLEAEGALSALTMALAQLPEKETHIIHHSDRGIQYCCDKYTSKLNSSHVKISMTENGDPLENALAERVNGILKTEWLNREATGTKWEMASGLAGVIDAYNNRRPHLSINMMTPEAAHCCQGEIPRKWKNYWKEKEKPLPDE